VNTTKLAFSSVRFCHFLHSLDATELDQDFVSVKFIPVTFYTP